MGIITSVLGLLGGKGSSPPTTGALTAGAVTQGSTGVTTGQLAMIVGGFGFVMMVAMLVLTRRGK